MQSLISEDAMVPGSGRASAVRVVSSASRR
jgi:hypothetical protein